MLRFQALRALKREPKNEHIISLPASSPPCAIGCHYPNGIALIVQSPPASAGLPPQVPATHRSPPVHLLPHAPQFSLSERAFTSQPSDERPLQFNCPALHTKLQVFATQTALAPVGVGQTVPQTPQFVGSLLRLAQAVPHLTVPPTHERAHALLVHTSPAGQVVPHAPQFAGSLVMSTQLDPHLVVPPPQTSWHDELTQLWPVGQTVPHAPQLFGSRVVSTQELPHFTAPPLHTS